jgi:hypothetical protein
VDCPYCAETIEDGAKRCPSCGELLDEGGRTGAGGGASKVLIVLLVMVVVCFAGTGLLAALLLPALNKVERQASRTKCSNNLRQLGLASLQYADDKRFFPHVGPLAELDGDVATSDGPRKARTLVHFGYHDNPEGFICPQSYDLSVPMTPAAMNNTQLWFWNGGTNPSAPGLSPIVDGAPDPALDQTHELSYGTTRKGLNSNTRSTTLLGADRALRDGTDVGNPLEGNHDGGWNVLQADCTVWWASRHASPPPGVWLTRTDPPSDPAVQAGYLAIKPNQ